jgi:hypothetical protein
MLELTAKFYYRNPGRFEKSRHKGYKINDL